jgi:hypothetical protein
VDFWDIIFPRMTVTLKDNSEKEVVMKRYALSLAFCLLSATAAFAQTKSPLEGVWKIVEEVEPSTNSADKGATITHTNPQPGLLIFTKGYYSFVIVTAPEPRAKVAPPKDPRNLTDAEKIAWYEQWKPFSANSGTYEIKELKLSIRPIVAKGVDLMNRQTPITWELKIEGPNTLWLIPIGQSPTQPRVKLARLE